MQVPKCSCHLSDKCQIRGQLYKQNIILVTGFRDDLPLFGIITNVLSHDYSVNNVFFILKRLETLSYSRHMCSYIVKRLDDIDIISFSLFVSYHPLDYYQTYVVNQLHIPLRYILSR